MHRLAFLMIVTLALVPGVAAATENTGEPKPVFQPLDPASTKSLGIGGTEHVPSPVTTALAATLEATGQVRYACRGGENPAYTAYQARVEAAIRALETR
jgi:hypothetical protein